MHINSHHGCMHSHKQLIIAQQVQEENGQGKDGMLIIIGLDSSVVLKFQTQTELSGLNASLMTFTPSLEE